MRFHKTLLVMTLAAGCAVQTSGQADRQPQPQPQPTAGKPTPSSKKVDPAVVERLQRVMLPLVAKMNKPLPANQVKVGIMDDPHINAASAGSGEFYVTTGLLEKANDDQCGASWRTSSPTTTSATSPRRSASVPASVSAW